jgi:hypothetical protein
VIKYKEKTTHFHYLIKHESAPIKKHKLTCLLIFYFSCVNITMVWKFLYYRHWCSCLVYIVYCSRSKNKSNIGRSKFRPKEFLARTLGPMRNEYEGAGDSILPSKKILIGPKVRAENSLGRNSCNS